MINVADLYKNLFGRKGIADGDVISMAEHGRAGGISTGQGYKFTQTYLESTRTDEPDSTTTYIGYVENGSVDSTSEAIWRIYKIVVSGTQEIVYKADGNDSYDNVWDNRTSLTYS